MAALPGILVAALLAVLVNACAVILMGPEKGELGALNGVFLDLPPGSSALQLTEAAYGSGELVMLRLGPVSAAAKGDGEGSFFSPARPGYLAIDGAQSFAFLVKECSALELRPGHPSDKRAATTLMALLPGCSAGLRLARFSARETSPELAQELGDATNRVIETADIVLESPSSFSLVFGAEKKRELFHPLPRVDAARLELAEPWTIEPEILRRCECEKDDLVELAGPVVLEALYMAKGELHARIELGESSSISCGKGGASCGFNWRLLDFTAIAKTLLSRVAKVGG